MFPFIQCQRFDKRRGVYLLEKVSVFIEIRVLLWQEISALGVFLNFDNERMRPPLYLSAPTGLVSLSGHRSFLFIDVSVIDVSDKNLP